MSSSPTPLPVSAPVAARFPPAFRWLLAAETVSLFGSLISRIALPFVAVLFLQARPMQVALLGVADIAAGVASALLLGTWVERWPKRRTMLCADLARAALLAAVPLGAWMGWLGMPLLLAIAFACGVLNVAFELAQAALLPRLVPSEHLLAANSRIAAGQSVVETASFGIGGWSVQWLGPPLAVLADALSYLVSAWLIWRAGPLPDAPAARPAPAAGAWRAFADEAREGVRLLWRDPALRALAAVEACLAGGMQMFGAVFLLFLAREVGFAPGVLGMVFAVGGLSSFAGALLAERLTRRFSAGPMMVAGLVFVAAGLFLPPLVAGVGAGAVALLVAQQLLGDGAHTVYLVNDRVLRQTRAPAEALARVNAGIKFVGLAAMLAGALLGGWLAEQASARAALLVAAGWVSLGAGVALACGLQRVRGR